MTQVSPGPSRDRRRSSSGSSSSPRARPAACRSVSRVIAAWS